MVMKLKPGPRMDAKAAILAERAAAQSLPLFDEGFYNQQLPQFAQQAEGALTHFLTTGEKLGLKPHPLFDRAYVLAQAADARVAIEEDFSPFLYVLESDISPCRLFSVSHYRAELAKAGVEISEGEATISHFLSKWSETRVSFSPYFDMHFYQLNNPHLINSNSNPLEHYFRVPRHERADANPMFHAGYYTHTYHPGDVDPLVDFLDTGHGQLNLPNPYAAQELLSDAFVTPKNLLQYIETRSSEHG